MQAGAGDEKGGNQPHSRDCGSFQRLFPRALSKGSRSLGAQAQQGKGHLSVAPVLLGAIPLASVGLVMHAFVGRIWP